MTWTFLFLFFGMVTALTWLVAGVQAGNTATTRERQWLFATTMLVLLFWPIVVVLGIIGSYMDDNF